MGREPLLKLTKPDLVQRNAVGHGSEKAITHGEAKLDIALAEGFALSGELQTPHHLSAHIESV